VSEMGFPTKIPTGITTSITIFLYQDFKYDERDPWKGLLRSKLMITAIHYSFGKGNLRHAHATLLQGYKHIFTSPSSVEKEPKATKSGNARIHGMKATTPASIAYVATQVILLLVGRDGDVSPLITIYGSLIFSIFDLHCLHRQLFPVTTERQICSAFITAF
jgi:hypothetical protein